MQSENTQKTSSDNIVVNIYKYTNAKHDTRHVLIYDDRAWRIDNCIHADDLEFAFQMFIQGFGLDPSDHMDKLTFIETVSKQTHPHYFI